MSYDYQTQKPIILTDQGQRMFLAIRDRACVLFREAGAARMQEMWKGQTGSTWEMIACVDRMVELGEIRELTPTQTIAQHRVFVLMKD